MSAHLEDVAGVRQQLAVVLPVRLRETPGAEAADGRGEARRGWQEGPCPFESGSRRTDTATRSGYFAPESARVLYGAGGRPCRWHKAADAAHEGLTLHAMELLRTSAGHDSGHALAVLHFTVERPVLPVLRAIGHRSTAERDPLTGPLDPGLLLGELAEIRTGADSFAIGRPYTVAFFTPGASAAYRKALRPDPRTRVPQSADRWLWQLASRSVPADYPIAPENVEGQLGGQAVRISADWSALVLRHGAAFLGHRADAGEGDFYEFGALHARSIYLDALLLGMLQRDHVNGLTDELSAVFDGAHLAGRVAALEKNIAFFRSTYWRRHLTAHGAANDLLLAFQTQHRLADRFGEILAEAGDYSRLVQNQESQQIGAALGVLTVLGLPLGTALGILQVLGDTSVAHLLLALGASVAATAAALTTRYGRLVLSSLRGSAGPKPP